MPQKKEGDVNITADLFGMAARSGCYTDQLAEKARKMVEEDALPQIKTPTNEGVSEGDDGSSVDTQENETI